MLLRCAALPGLRARVRWSPALAVGCCIRANCRRQPAVALVRKDRYLTLGPMSVTVGQRAARGCRTGNELPTLEADGAYWPHSGTRPPRDCCRDPGELLHSLRGRRA